MGARFLTVGKELIDKQGEKAIMGLSWEHQDEFFWINKYTDGYIHMDIFIDMCLFTV